MKPSTVLIRSLLVLSLIALGGFGCDDDAPDPNDPTEVVFGDTALVVVLNPVINDADEKSSGTPGTVRSGVTLTTDDKATATTSALGIAVLGPLTPGVRTVTLSGGGLSGTFTVTMGTGELREIAVAADGAAVQIMVEIDYKSDQMTEINPTMTLQQVNDALAVSDTVVFFQGGTYEGDIDFSGSRVTLFGAGLTGGEVTINGKVTVSGSDSRIRGTRITGDLVIPASGVGISFSRVDGATTSDASDLTLLSNALCGGATLTGSGAIALDNAGAPPISNCP